MTLNGIVTSSASEITSLGLYVTFCTRLPLFYLLFHQFVDFMLEYSLANLLHFS